MIWGLGSMTAGCSTAHAPPTLARAHRLSRSVHLHTRGGGGRTPACCAASQCGLHVPLSRRLKLTWRVSLGPELAYLYKVRLMTPTAPRVCAVLAPEGRDLRAHVSSGAVTRWGRLLSAVTCVGSSAVGCRARCCCRATCGGQCRGGRGAQPRRGYAGQDACGGEGLLG